MRPSKGLALFVIFCPYFVARIPACHGEVIGNIYSEHIIARPFTAGKGFFYRIVLTSLFCYDHQLPAPSFCSGKGCLAIGVITLPAGVGIQNTGAEYNAKDNKYIRNNRSPEHFQLLRLPPVRLPAILAALHTVIIQRTKHFAYQTANLLKYLPL